MLFFWKRSSNFLKVKNVVDYWELKLGLTQKTITNYGQEFSDAGFTFERVGIRKGGEIARSIDKENNQIELFPSSTKGVKEAFSKAFDP